MDRRAFGRQVLALRQRKGMSQQELAKAAGLTPGAICHIEKGRRIGSHRTLHRLETALNLKRGELAVYLPSSYLDGYSHRHDLQIPVIPVIDEQGNLTGERLWLSEILSGGVAIRVKSDKPEELVCKGDYLINRPGKGRIAVVRLCR